jgi:phage terminase small subunit
VAKRGRKPRPTELKVLVGTRKDRINAAEPAAPAGRPECPDYLKGYAREGWAELVEVLDRMGVLTQADGMALAIFAATYARWRRALAKLDGPAPDPADLGLDLAELGLGGPPDTLTDSTAAGGLKVGAYVRIAAEAERDMARMLVEFGLTPSSRSRVAVADRKPIDPLAKFKRQA